MEAGRGERFLLWRKQSLWKIRACDIGVKIFLVLPFVLPVFYMWSSIIWNPNNSTGPSRLTFLSEVPRYIMPPLLVWSLPLLSVFVELNRIYKIQTKKTGSDIDWSKKKFQQLADAARAAGINVSKTRGKLEVVDRWRIQIYQRPRDSPLGCLLGLSGFFLAVAFIKYKGMILDRKDIVASLFLALTLPFYVVLVILRTLDVFKPRLELLISSLVVTRLRGDSAKLRLLVSHEFSHERHQDPFKTLMWAAWGGISRIYLFLAGLLLLTIIIFKIRDYHAIPKVAILVAWLSGIVCWLIGTIQVRKLITLFQELRADLEAVRSPNDCEALAELLLEIPIESKLDSVLNQRGSWKAIVTRFRRRNEIRRIREHSEQVENRIKMLTTGTINPIDEGELFRKLLFAYGSVLISIAAFHILLLGSAG